MTTTTSAESLRWYRSKVYLIAEKYWLSLQAPTEKLIVCLQISKIFIDNFHFRSILLSNVNQFC